MERPAPIESMDDLTRENCRLRLQLLESDLARREAEKNLQLARTTSKLYFVIFLLFAAFCFFGATAPDKNDAYEEAYNAAYESAYADGRFDGYAAAAAEALGELAADNFE